MIDLQKKLESQNLFIKALQEKIAALEAKKTSLYVHKESGNTYEFIGEGRFRLSEGEWIEAAFYKSEDSKLYGRYENDFYEKFDKKL